MNQDPPQDDDPPARSPSQGGGGITIQTYKTRDVDKWAEQVHRQARSPSMEEFLLWLTEHPEEAEQYASKYVIFSLERGIGAVADTMPQLVQELAREQIDTSFSLLVRVPRGV